MAQLRKVTHLVEGSGCSLFRSDWHCSLWPVGETWQGVRHNSTTVCENMLQQQCMWMWRVSPHRQRGIFVQLVFGSNAETSVVAASCPGQGNRRLQLVIYLLVDGAAKLSPVITEREQTFIYLRKQKSILQTSLQIINSSLFVFHLWQPIMKLVTDAQKCVLGHWDNLPLNSNQFQVNISMRKVWFEIGGDTNPVG